MSCNSAQQEAVLLVRDSELARSMLVFTATKIPAAQRAALPYNVSRIQGWREWRSDALASEVFVHTMYFEQLQLTRKVIKSMHTESSDR